MRMRKYEEGDEVGIVSLFKKTPFNETTLEYWNWQYKQNPSGFFRNIWLMLDNGEVVGHYAIIPQRMVIRGKQYLGAQSLATATHPDYRRRGIFKTLAEKTYEDARLQNILLIYGFAVEASYYGFIERLGWQDFFLIKHLVKVLDVDAFFKGKSNIQKLAYKMYSCARNWFKKEERAIEYTFNIEETKRYNKGYDVFWRKVLNNFDVITVRDSKYLNWRYVDRPHRSYFNFICKNQDGEILGYLVLTILEKNRVGYVVDLLTIDNENVVNDLTKKAVEFLRNRNATAITCHFPKHSPYYPTFKRNGFIDIGARGFADRFIAKVNMENSVTSWIKEAKSLKWFITYGDSGN
jgi:GNAT superfamily N-acetyltransferase